MAMYRHIVLFMYIAELCAFVALSVGYAWSGGRIRRKTSNVKAYHEALDAMRELSGEQYQLLTEANELIAKAEPNEVDVSEAMSDVLEDGKGLLDAYKIIQKDKLKLDIWDVVAYKHDIVQLNLTSLADAIAALEDGDGETALESLFNVDTTYLSSVFSKEVYEYTGIHALDPSRDDLF